MRWDDPWPSAALSAHHGVSARLRVGGRVGCEIRASTSAAPSWKIVALGDSDHIRTGRSHPRWLGGQLRSPARRKLGSRSRGESRQEGMTSGQLLARVRSGSSTGIGSAKGPRSSCSGSEALNEWRRRQARGREEPSREACYAPVMQAFGRNFDATAASIRSLKRGTSPSSERSAPETSLIGAEDLIPSFLKQCATSG